MACQCGLRLQPAKPTITVLAAKLLSRLKSGAMLLADRGYDADWIRALASQHGAWANTPPRRNRNDALCFSPYLYRARNLIERFFNRIKQCRRMATRYDKLAAGLPGFLTLQPRFLGLQLAVRTLRHLRACLVLRIERWRLVAGRLQSIGGRHALVLLTGIWRVPCRGQSAWSCRRPQRHAWNPTA